jgi:hypothetical protein
LLLEKFELLGKVAFVLGKFFLLLVELDGLLVQQLRLGPEFEDLRVENVSAFDVFLLLPFERFELSRK